MTRAIVFDLSYTLLFPKDKTYIEELNKLYKEIEGNPDFNFSSHFYLDEDIFEYVKSLKDKRDLYIFTSGIIQNDPEIKEKLESVFIKIYSAEEMGIHKSNPNSYIRLSEEISLSPNEIVFVDDNKRNIDAAQKAGLNTILFIDLESLKVNLQIN